MTTQSEDEDHFVSIGEAATAVCADVAARLGQIERVLMTEPDISIRRAAAAEYIRLTEPVAPAEVAR